MAADESRVAKLAAPQGQITIQASTLVGVLTIGVGGWQSFDAFRRQQDDLAQAVRALSEDARATKNAIDRLASASDDTRVRLQKLEQWRSETEPTLALCAASLERRH